MDVTIFPDFITQLPMADISIDGVKSRLMLAEQHQIIFMQFTEEVVIPEHFHESQWGIVLEGKIDLIVDGVKNTFVKGDRYFIPKDIRHSATIYAGYADITFFNQKDRYKELK